MAPTLIAIAGPTASGKTALAIALARHWQAPILSFDSRQCYQEMRIGVARPTPAELAQAPHYFIASHSIHQPVDAAAYESYALQLLQGLFAQHPLVVAVGGTGLYLKALLYGLDDMPNIDENLRQQLRQQYALHGLPWLQQQLAQYDAAWLQTGDANNPHRMLRALEVVKQTGKSIKQFQQQQTTPRPFQHHTIGLAPDREWLYNRINHRVLHMMEEGLLQEVKDLAQWQHLQPLQTVGYTELFAHLQGQCSLSQAVQAIQQHTRHYAKRQLTWFRKQPHIHWLGQPNAEEAIQLAESLLTK